MSKRGDALVSSFAVASASMMLSGLGSREADWLTEALDVLIFSIAPDGQPRRELLAAADGIAVQWADRLTGPQTILLAKLFAAAGLGFPLPPSSCLVVEARRPKRSFRRVGIYSLAESAAKRARQWIEEQWPGVSVALAREHVNGERLQAMARNCDVVVVQTSHAKQAAVAALDATQHRAACC